MTATLTPRTNRSPLGRRDELGAVRTAPSWPMSPDHDSPHDVPGASQRTARAATSAWGRSSVSPFNIGEGRELLGRTGLCGTGFLRHRRWAVMATDPATAPGREEEGLDLTLELLAAERLRPTFAAVTDPASYRRRGMWTTTIADDPIIDLTAFDPAGKRRANIRHSVGAAGSGGWGWIRSLDGRCCRGSVG